MALTKLTATRHNIKRAEALARHGINTLDLPQAKPEFMGYSDGTCDLCGQKNLRWIFKIYFDKPQGLLALAKVECGIDREGAVTITPVGSKCINDWIDALPETAEKLALLKRWEREMRSCKLAMKAKVVEDLCVAAGFETPEDAFDAYIKFFFGRGYNTANFYHYRKVLAYDEVASLRRNARKVRNKTLSRKTCQDWLRSLLKLIELGPLPEKKADPKPEPASAPVTPAPVTPAQTELGQLLERGRKAFEQNASALVEYSQKAFQDIARKVGKRGKFASDRQRSYYTDMLKKLEQ